MQHDEQSLGRRVLVCGGRDYQDWPAVSDTLWRLHDSSPIGLIIHGCDPGAATLAARWALLAGIPGSGFDADFNPTGLPPSVFGTHACSWKVSRIWSSPFRAGKGPPI